MGWVQMMKGLSFPCSCSPGECSQTGSFLCFPNGRLAGAFTSRQAGFTRNYFAACPGSGHTKDQMLVFLVQSQSKTDKRLYQTLLLFMWVPPAGMDILTGWPAG
jgi:hypothetical protein